LFEYYYQVIQYLFIFAKFCQANRQQQHKKLCFPSASTIVVGTEATSSFVDITNDSQWQFEQNVIK